MCSFLLKKKHLLKVVILDAAVLLEAGWHNTCHEVWVCLVPRYSWFLFCGGGGRSADKVFKGIRQLPINSCTRLDTNLMN